MLNNRFRYRAEVKLELSDATTVRHSLRGILEAGSRHEAERIVDDVVREQGLDLGGEDVDAPVESVEIIRVHWD